jgi:hypothetical protein
LRVSYLSNNISDDQDITVRIHKASTQQAGALTNFFRNKAVDVLLLYLPRN